jgi:hypothetical protein
MSRRVRHFAVVLAALLTAPVLGSLPAHAAEEGAPTEGEKVLVKLKLQHGGKTHEHPGYMAVTGEETILELTAGEHTYEVSIQLEKRDGKWHLAVVFTADGTEVVSGKNAAAKPGSWIDFKKGKDTVVSLHFDPSAGRKDEVEMPGGKGPLDGAK